MAHYRAAVVGLSGIAAGPRQPAPDPVLGEAMPHSHVAAYAAVPTTTVVAVCDLDLGLAYKRTVFDFDRYRRPEMYTRITSQQGAVEPADTES